MGSDVYGLPSRETYPDSQNRCSDGAKIRSIIESSKYFGIFFIARRFFLLSSSLFPILFVPLQCPTWCLRMKGGRWHIRKASLMLCFWPFERRKFKSLFKNNCGDECYGCSIYSRSVLRGQYCPHAHFSGVLYTIGVGIQTLLVLMGGLPRA